MIVELCGVGVQGGHGGQAVLGVETAPDVAHVRLEHHLEVGVVTNNVPVPVQRIYKYTHSLN